MASPENIFKFIMTLEVEVNIQHKVVTNKTLSNLKRAGHMLQKVKSTSKEKEC